MLTRFWNLGKLLRITFHFFTLITGFLEPAHDVVLRTFIPLIWGYIILILRNLVEASPFIVPASGGLGRQFLAPSDDLGFIVKPALNRKQAVCEIFSLLQEARKNPKQF